MPRRERATRSAGQTFSKVSVLRDLLYKFTVWGTFENVRLCR
jgi:hypothetical protein